MSSQAVKFTYGTQLLNHRDPETPFIFYIYLVRLYFMLCYFLASIKLIMFLGYYGETEYLLKMSNGNRYVNKVYIILNG